MTLRQIVAVTCALAVLLFSALYATYWFHHRYVGWLVQAVPDALAYRASWQQQLDRVPGLQHPAVIHYLPNECLCRVLSIKHAQQLTQKAKSGGFQVFQLNSEDTNLGQPLQLAQVESPLSPQILITQPNGNIAYVGAYSDGIRCNTGNSLVDDFLSSVTSLPTQPSVGLDVQTCRCLD